MPPLNPNDDEVELIETLEQPTLSADEQHHIDYQIVQQHHQQQHYLQHQQHEPWHYAATVNHDNGQEHNHQHHNEKDNGDDDDNNDNYKYDSINHQIMHSDAEYEYFEEDRRRRMLSLMHRISRIDDITNGIYHPTLVPFEDKRIAGVSMQNFGLKTF